MYIEPFKHKLLQEKEGLLIHQGDWCMWKREAVMELIR